MKTTVRRAEKTDVDWLLEQARKFERFAGYKRKLVGSDKNGRAVLLSLVESHIVLIAEEHQCRRGFIAGYLAHHPFNPRIRVLSEVLWWVPKEFRGGIVGGKLLLEFEVRGRALADWTVLSLEHNSPFRPQHLLRRGFRQVETAFLLENN